MLDRLFAFVWKPFLSRVNVSQAEEDLWHSISLFNLYRLLLASLSVLLAANLANTLSPESSNVLLFWRASAAYFVLVLLSQFAIKLRQPRISMQLAFQIGSDIVCLTILSHAAGGTQSGLGMLLLISLAAAGLISRGKITLFYAALASIAILLQHAYVVLTSDGVPAQFLQAGLLSAAYFVTGWLAHRLAKYALASEKLATTRGFDLANMAEANRLLIQDIPDGVLVVDELGVVRQSNPSAERLLGYTFPISTNVTLAECSVSLAEQFAAWRKDVSHKSTVLRLAFRNQARVRFLPVQSQGFWGAVVFLEEMQREQAQAQQIKLAALGRLTANIAHEVRNPLASISYAAELLREGSHNPEQARLLQIILDNTLRLNRIVQDVMRLNHRDRVHTESLSLADFLPIFIKALCQSERVELTVFYIEAQAPCVIQFDRVHLEQVLWNLCRNALRYCSKQTGSVQLLVQKSSRGILSLGVSDDGPGIGNDELAKLFEPFYTTASGGTGLGLYIARELCDANDAELEYVPQAGGGASFRIVFGGDYER